ncbi:RING finger domain-containing protein [Rutstroemia sp. NJR-2017a WRK4]|nr:RING finger domain-containing protein [Rutstroemia sp. NJR-2017a WRK4]
MCWTSAATNDQLTNEVSQLSPNISYAETISNNLRTLSTHNADASGVIGGFLYVPDLNRDDACYNISKQYVPTNVTRQSNLPPTDFTLIALAPWISVECTQGYLAAAREDPVRAFIFYQPDNSTSQPPPISSEQWSLRDGGSWKTANNFPAYAVPGSLGARMMYELSRYSGNLTDVPHGHQLSMIPGVDPRDYVRIYTQLDLSQGSSLPNLWEFLLIIIAVLVLMLAVTSGSMHYIQRSRRRALRRRVQTGEVNLEALGIKRLTVPQEIIDNMPLFTYNCGTEELAGTPKDPNTPILHESQESPGNENTTVANSTTSNSIQPVAPVNNEATLTLTQDHRLVSFSQPTCPICLDDFEAAATLIRELPCGHIFHPDCIDPFLSNNSSLCPMCKKSVLPVGYCPTEITNAMVTRERNMRRLRSRIMVQDDRPDLEEGHRRISNRSLSSAWKRRIFTSSTAVSNEVQLTSAMPNGTVPPLMTNALSAQPPTAEVAAQTRQERARQRLEELAAQQPQIEDPDLATRRQQSAWRRAILKIFPGYS